MGAIAAGALMRTQPAFAKASQPATKVNFDARTGRIRIRKAAARSAWLPCGRSTTVSCWTSCRRGRPMRRPAGKYSSTIRRGCMRLD